MVKIRLRRMGAKKNPFYRIVVADSRSPRDGRCIEEVGTYNPLVKPAQIKVNKERVEYWIGQGAQPTDTVRALLKKLDGAKAESAKAAAAKAENAKAESPKAESAKAEETKTESAKTEVPADE